MTPRGPSAALLRCGSSPHLVAGHCAGLVFMAAPYAEAVHLRGGWRIERSTRLSVQAAREVLRLYGVGVTAICATLQQAEMCHAASLVPDPPDPLDAAKWAAWAQPLLNAARLIVVPQIEGWDRCPLIWQQVTWALDRNLPVHLYAEAAP